MIARKMLQFQPIAFDRWICGWGQSRVVRGLGGRFFRTRWSWICVSYGPKARRVGVLGHHGKMPGARKVKMTAEMFRLERTSGSFYFCVG